jgi:PAS domain S-box-containing protein
MNRAENPAPAARGLRSAFPWIVLAVSLAGTLLASYLLREATAARAKLAFDAAVESAHERVKERMTDYAQVLRGGAALFAVKGKVDRAAWREYVAGLHLHQNFPGVQAIGYAEVLAPQEKDAHVARVRAEGFSGYDLRPEGERALYAPVLYVEPFVSANLRALGYDMYAEQTRRAAMERARDSGDAALSGKVTLVQDTKQARHQAGTLLYMPVYRRDMPHASEQERRHALQGYVYAAFRMSDLMRSIVGGDFSELDIEVFDGDKIVPDALLFDGDQVLHAFALHYPARFRKVKVIEIAGRAWSVDCSLLPTARNNIDTSTAQLMLFAGSAISVLLFGVAWTLSATRARAEGLARRMASSASESEARLHGIIDSAMDAIITTDDAQRIVLFNAAAEKIFRCSAAEAIGSRLERFIPERFRAAHHQHVDVFGRTGVSSREMGARLDIIGLRADGEEFPIDASISQLVQDGKRYFTVILRDIMARKQAESALLAANQFSREVMDNAHEGIVVYDRQLNAVAWNRFMEDLTGVPAVQALGRNLYDLFPTLGQENTQPYFERVFAGETTVPSAFRARLRGTREFLPPDFDWRSSNDPRVAWTLSSFAPHRTRSGEVIGVIITVIDVTELKRSQDELHRTNEGLRQLSVHAESVREAERTRIAREIHDELAGTLTGIKMDLSSANDQIKNDLGGLEARIAKSVRLVDNAVHTTRRIINDLRPSLLDNLGVWAAIEWQAHQAANDGSIECTVALEGDVADTELSPDRATALFRIVQESLSNVRRHAAASHVQVRARRANGFVAVDVVDDGKGIDEHDLDKAGHWGVLGMHERARAHGGSVTITGAPGRGTTVSVKMPLES